MSTKPTHSDKPRNPWPARAKYPVGKLRRQRQEQYRQQLILLVAVLVVTILAGAVIVLANWRAAGNSKAIDCATFPQYCVPLAGGSTVYAQLEAPDARALDTETRGAAGVVRYIAADNVPTIGNPSAPIHFRTVSNFTCSHCGTFHNGDLERFIENYVLDGKATFGFVMLTGGQPASETATLAALCAGEQGALWEMSSELFRLARTQGAAGFALSTIRDSADDMGLDDARLATCVADAAYMNLLTDHANFAAENGVTGTPTVFVSYGGDWMAVNRSYDSLVQLTEKANAE